MSTNEELPKVQAETTPGVTKKPEQGPKGDPAVAPPLVIPDDVPHVAARPRPRPRPRRSGPSPANLGRGAICSARFDGGVAIWHSHFMRFLQVAQLACAFVAGCALLASTATTAVRAVHAALPAATHSAEPSILRDPAVTSAPMRGSIRVESAAASVIHRPTEGYVHSSVRFVAVPTLDPSDPWSGGERVVVATAPLPKQALDVKDPWDLGDRYTPSTSSAPPALDPDDPWSWTGPVASSSARALDPNDPWTGTVASATAQVRSRISLDLQDPWGVGPARL